MQKSLGFTLVELIVSITILAILATIAYISLLGYSQDARNSSRISDMKLIEKALSLFISVESAYPLPDERINMTYSGSSIFSQGVYSTGLIVQVGRISEVPLDTITQTPYSYAVTSDRSQYQLGGIMEGGLFAGSNPIIAQAYAINNNNISAYTLGSYTGYDLAVIHSGDCSVITAPSLLLSEMPSGGVLIKDDVYKYSYRNSPHLPNSYSGTIDIVTIASSFQLVEVLDNCRIDTIAELELYIAQLSTAYQPLSSNPIFEQLIFNSTNNNFRLAAVKVLQSNGIEVDEAVINELNAPLPDQVFVDTFTDVNSTNLAGGHIPDSGSGSWSMLAGGAAGAYNILSNRVSKTDATVSLVYPNPDPAIILDSYRISFDLENFAGGSVSAYLRYSDSDNYYRLDVSTSGYQLIRRLTGFDSILQNINDPIVVGDTIAFSIDGNTLDFSLNDIQKESILITGVTGVGVPAIYIHNSGGAIDNFSLTYK